MDLSLSFAAGKIAGDGIEKRGQFVIAGRYDPGSHECYWTKTYIGAHNVYYRGFREGKGIWGIWELPLGSGGFHIWPLSQGDGERQAVTIEEHEPVELVAAVRAFYGPLRIYLKLLVVEPFDRLSPVFMVLV